MNRPIRIEPEAAAELDEAGRWYDHKRPGLGMQFLEAIDVALSHIARWPRPIHRQDERHHVDGLSD